MVCSLTLRWSEEGGEKCYLPKLPHVTKLVVAFLCVVSCAAQKYNITILSILSGILARSLTSSNLQLTTTNGFFCFFIAQFKLEVKPNSEELVIWAIFHQTSVCETLGRKQSNISQYKWYNFNMNLHLWQPCVYIQYWHFFLGLLYFRWHAGFELQDLENKCLILNFVIILGSNDCYVLSKNPRCVSVKYQ